jgi:hypothetical protein
VNEPKAPENARSGVRAAFGAVVGLHLALIAYFAPYQNLFSKDPIVMVDYALHAYQVDRALIAFRHWHKLWGWDPFVLAGQPAGVAEDLTSKGMELFVIGLRYLGVHSGFAFNLFIAIVMLSVPFAAYAAARLFELTRPAAVVTALLWVLLWFFDSFMHWAWWIGMISWCAAAVGSVLLLGLLYRAFESKRAIWYLPITLLAPVLALVHPFAALTLIVPALAIYVRSFREIPKSQHALLALAALVAGSTALIWIEPALRFWHWVEGADTYFNAKLDYFFFDFFDMMRNSDHTGAPVRTIVRVLAFVAGIVMLLRWRRDKDRRVLPIAALALWCVAQAYLAAYTHAGRQTQPYRQIAPAMLIMALPASVLLLDLFRPSSLRALDGRAKLIALLAVALIVPRFVRTVLYYFPDAVPPSIATPLVQNEPKPWLTKLLPAEAPALEVRAWLEQNWNGRGRIVIGPWVLGEYLAASTRLPTLGGLEYRNIQQADAHLFRRAKNGDLPGPALREYFTNYAVGWVVLYGPKIPLENHTDLLELVAVVADHRIYRTKIEPSFVYRGHGTVVDQQFNSVKVEGASGDEIVLAFHWLESLACRPGCKVERFTVPDDRVGFIAVKNPPPSFEIYNEY